MHCFLVENGPAILKNYKTDWICSVNANSVKFLPILSPTEKNFSGKLTEAVPVHLYTQGDSGRNRDPSEEIPSLEGQVHTPPCLQQSQLGLVAS